MSVIAGVLISNTLILGILLMVFATIGLRTPVWVILLLAFVYGAFTSLQYTSMNTLVYADITRRGHERRKFHREHHAADVDQLRRRCRRAGDGVIRAERSLQPAAR